MAVGFSNFKGRAGTGNVKIIGLDSLQKDFTRMQTKTDSFITRQFHLAAERIAERANRDVPVDTGKLLRSINVVKGNLSATVRVEANYAGFVELGTKFMREQPFILKHVKPSIDIMMKNIKRSIGFK